MHRFLSFTSLLCAGFALLSVVWILIPAPAYHVWLFSVAVSEWSLWLGACALIGIILALLDYAFYEAGRRTTVALIFGGAAFLISLYPMLTAFQTAREKNYSLSFARYFDGLTGNKSNNQFKTYVYKSVGATELKMDVYPPRDSVNANGAGVVVIHGGSWNAGGRSDFPQWNAWLAANGFTVFDIDYTLAPQPNYAAAIGDVKCAVQYIKKRGAEFGVAPGKIVLLGRSAGGHLALIAAYSANDGQIPANCEENESAYDATVSAVVSFYAPTDLVWAYDNPANQLVIDGPQTIANFIGGNPRESAELGSIYALASPTAKVNTNSPPTLLIHGGHDQLVRRENLDSLAEKLKQNNVAHETLVIPYAQHGFDYNFNGWGSQIAEPLILRFLIDNTQK